MMCPSDDILTAYLDERLVLWNDHPLDKHLDTCRHCVERLEALSSLQGDSRWRWLLQSETSCRIELPKGFSGTAPPRNGSAGASRFNSLLRTDGELAGAPTVPGYSVEQFLGRGGMGEVYLARQESVGRLVALKVLLKSTLRDPEAKERHQAEVRAIAQLRHPNIVQVFDSGITNDGMPWCALEYCGLGSLADQSLGTALPPRRAAAIVADLADGMSIAHQAGFIHRDLKPANVLLSPMPTEQEPIPKVADFGLVRLMEVQDGPTATNAIVGTPSYMAPEQALARKKLTPAVDIRALGAILYELLTGRPPFRALETLDTLFQVVHEKPIPPRRLDPKIPRELETICLTCLNKDPRRRYASAAALEADLRAYLADRPIAARPPGAIGRLVKWSKRHPDRAILSASLLLTLLIAVGLILVQMHHVREARDDAEARAELASTARREADEQRRTAQSNAETAEVRRRQAQRAEAEALLDRGLSLCREGLLGEGLRLFGTVIERAEPIGAFDLSEAARLNLAAWLPAFLPSETSTPSGTPLTALAVFPDGTILTGSWGFRWNKGDPKGIVNFWKPGATRPEKPELPHPSAVLSSAIAPDGDTFALGGLDGSLRVRSRRAANQERLAVELPGRILALAFAPNGRHLLIGLELREPTLDPQSTRSLRGALIRIDLATANGEARMQYFPGPVRWVRYSPNGKFAVTASAPFVHVWDGETLQHQFAVGPFAEEILALAVAPDNRTTAIGGADHLIRRFDLVERTRREPPLHHRYPVAALCFSPDGEVLASVAGERGRGGELVLWNARNGSRVSAVRPHGDYLHGVAFSPDNRRVITIAENGRVNFYRWDCNSLGETVVEGPPIRSFDASMLGDSLIVSTLDNTIQVYRLTENMPPIRPFPANTDVGITTLAINHSGSLVACHDDRYLRLYDLTQGRFLPRKRLLPGRLSMLAWSADDQRLIVGECKAQAVVRFLDATSLRECAPAIAPKGCAQEITFSKDGSEMRIATKAFDNSAIAVERFCTITHESLAPPVLLPIRFPRIGSATAVSSFLLLAGSEAIHIYSAADGYQQEARIESWTESVRATPNERLVLSLHRQQEPRLWHLPTRKPVGPPLPLTDFNPMTVQLTDSWAFMQEGTSGSIRRVRLPQPWAGTPNEIRRRIEKLLIVEQLLMIGR